MDRPTTDRALANGAGVSGATVSGAAMGGLAAGTPVAATANGSMANGSISNGSAAGGLTTGGSGAGGSAVNGSAAGRSQAGSPAAGGPAAGSPETDPAAAGLRRADRRNWAAAPWTDAEPLECAMVVPEVADTATFTFRAPSGAWFDYQPGQFITLDLPVDPANVPAGNVQRTYTISSSPSRPLSISVTAKAQSDSLGTRWMLDHLRPGMRIRAYGPSGIFSFHRYPAAKYLFISAGSGITPTMAMTTWAWDSGAMPDIVFVHAARRPSEIIFRERLEQMANRVPGLQLRFTIEEPDPFRAWPGYQGRLSQIMLGLMAPDYLEREVFCCGPEPFMQAVRDMLASLGYDMDHYHQESFGAPVRTEAEAPVIADVTPDAAAKAELVFALSGRSTHCSETDTVLAVAKRAGLNIPSGCTFGLCGTCRTRKLSGEVHMVHNGGISEEDIAEGWILACCSHPLGRVEIAL